MSGVVKALLEYADHHISPALLRKSGYCSASKELDACWKALEKGLSRKQKDHLEALMEKAGLLYAKDAETAFQSGLAIGLELGRLQPTSPRKRRRRRCPSPQSPAWP